MESLAAAVCIIQWYTSLSGLTSLILKETNLPRTYASIATDGEGHWFATWKALATVEVSWAQFRSSCTVPTLHVVAHGY